MIQDDTLREIIATCDSAPEKDRPGVQGLKALAVYTLMVREGIREVMNSEFIMWEEREALEKLL